jgi:hypothetical protein
VDQPKLTKVAILSNHSAMYSRFTMQYEPTPRTTVRRLKKRAVYDKAAVHAIRHDETLYFHGAVASRTLRTLATGVDVCLTVTLMDGMVLARSAFHHSMNYRSVLVLGNARLVQDLDERLLALKVITDHAVPGRWDEVRGPNELEMKQTSVLALPLEEVSAKVRTGPPVDDDEDYSLPVWAGVVPIETHVTRPISDGRVLPGVAEPNLSRFNRFLKPAQQPP